MTNQKRGIKNDEICKTNMLFKKIKSLLTCVRNKYHKLQWTMYGKFWKIYLQQVFSFEGRFKLLLNIEVFYANDEHILESGLCNNANVIYDKKKLRVAIVNDYEAVVQYCEYKVKYYRCLMR